MTFKFVGSAVVLLVFRFLPTTLSLVNNDGWIPLTKNEVLKKLDRDFMYSTSYQYLPYPMHKGNDEMDILRKDAIKMVLPQKRLLILPSIDTVDKVNQELNDQQKSDINSDLHTTENKTNKHYDVSEGDESVEDGVNQEATTEIIKRQAKHILEVDLTNHLKTKPAKKTLIETKLPTDLEKPFVHSKGYQEIHRNYQVTEDIPDFAADEADSKRSGYIYKIPGTNSKSTTVPNTTNTFLDKLFKYNIKVDDNLPNYALSRQTKGPIPNFMLIPVPLNIPPRFNSLNHFSVDPLLAVFLSNYGYYLPGSYGIQNKYKNLYGYLASNNIHNNKPFGAYKLYSDTDASN